MASIMIIGTNMMNIYNHRLELIKSLLSLNFQVSVVAPKGGEEKSLLSMGVRFIDTPVDNRGTNPKNDLRLLKSLIRIIKNENPDVILTFYTKTNIYGGLACRFTSTPYIENITGLGSAIANGGFKQKIMIWLYKQAVKDASIVFFQNTHNQLFFKEKRIRTKKTHLLPGSGVSLERYLPLPYPSSNTIEFLFISRVIKEKGIDEYLEAAKAITKKYPNTVFHVIGPAEDKYIPILEEHQRNGYIKYHGKLFDIKPLLLKSHCTVFPSYYAEGMANVLLESAASARPIITTNLPGCGETVEGGKTGYVVKHQDSSDLISKIEKFILLPFEEKKNMGLNGRAKMEKEFDRNIITDAYINEIKLILKNQNL